MTQTLLFPSHDLPAPGTVSNRCRFHDENGTRFVLIDDQIVWMYDLQDKLAMRQTWVTVVRAGYAKQKELSQALGIGLRSVGQWMSRYREQGAQGLLDKARCGAPRKVTAAVQRRILSLRQKRYKITAIAQAVNVATRTVNRVLKEAAHQQDKQQACLPGMQARPSSPAEPTPCPSADSAQCCPAPTTASAQSQPSSSFSLCPDPLDRWEDRPLARLGFLQDATPIFAQAEKVEWAGAFMAMGILATDPLLKVAQELYGHSQAAFYGLRTVLVTLVLMALLRIKRPEDLRRYDPVKLGRLLGLDRVAEVKTLRRKLRALCDCHQAAAFMERLARERLKDYEGDPRTVFIDGHIQAYSGQVKVGELYSSREKKVLRGRTQYWAHLPGATPLFSVTSEFNEALTKALPGVLDKVQSLLGQERLTCVFDRGGYAADLFERLLSEGKSHLITYRKGDKETVPLKKFTRQETIINGKSYAYAPYEQTVQIPVYEHKQVNGKGKRRKTKRTVQLRQIHLLRKDGGQTVLLTSRQDCSAVEVAECLFSRWGNQENFFKYLLAEYDLHALWNYESEAIHEPLDHPHPQYVRLEKKAAQVQKQRGKILTQYGACLEAMPEEKILEKLRELKQSKQAEKLHKLTQELEAVKAKMAQSPERESLSQAGYKQLQSEINLLMNTIKITAYGIETRLRDLLSAFYPRSQQEGRRVIVAALQSSGQIRLEPGRIVIRLQKQSSACRTRAINQLCAQLNELGSKYPGSDLQIVFEATPVDG